MSRTISLHRASRLAAQHSTSVVRLFSDYPPLRAAVVETNGEELRADARVPLSPLVAALGY